MVLSGMGKRSRDKGAGFERQVAKIFGEAYGIKLRRTPMSGGWAQGAEEVAGDLVSVDPDYEFAYCVECKKQEGWRLESLLTGNHTWFDDWWRQLMNECPNDKTPLLVFSRNRAPIFVAGLFGAICCETQYLVTFVDNMMVTVVLLDELIKRDTGGG